MKLKPLTFKVIVDEEGGTYVILLFLFHMLYSFLPSIFCVSLCVLIFVCLFVCFLRSASVTYEVPRLVVNLELQLLACATATATWDPNLICDLSHVVATPDP